MGQFLRTIFLSIIVCCSASAQDVGLEEVVVTGARSTDAAPVVISVKGDFHLQPIRLINDSLVAEEREGDIQAAFSEIISSSLNSKTISIVRGRSDLNPIQDSKKFNEWFVDNEQSRKSYLDLMIKSEIKKHNPTTGTYAEKYTKFINEIGDFGRTKAIFYGESDITIVNPRQYRGQLIKAIGKDMQTLTQALGGKYGAVIEGLDSEVKWHRVGEENVEFYIPYSFLVLPENIRSLPSEY